jgi:hypothetical protein
MKYKWHSESVQFNSITILRSEKSAQTFLDKIYPHWTDTIVVTADGVFPKSQQLKEAALSLLSSEDKLPVVVFGATSLESIPVVSSKKLIMDEFLNNDMYRFDTAESAFNWNERSIAMFCFIWVNQNNSELRLNYENMTDLFHPDSIRWYNKLVYE